MAAMFINQIKPYLFAVLAAIVAIMITVPIAQFLFGIVGDSLGDRYNTQFLGNFFNYGTSLLIGFFIGVVLGWFTKTKGWLYGGVAAISAVVLESVSRYVRFAGAVSVGATLSAVYSPRLFLFNYILLTAGLILGALVGNKALEENHRIRLYIFSAFLALLIVTCQLYFYRFGLVIFNPFSTFRGVF